ncbi:MAG: hypothetical protein ABL886_02405 [Rhodoglobus sp.]
MPDSFRVTIVAEAPLPPNLAAPPYIPDPGHEQTVTLLTPITKVMRAKHIEDVALRITEAWNDPKRNGRKLALQIVGHGVSGVLHLGSSWLENQLEIVYADPFYCLDTNPWSLGFLGEHRGKFDQITLVACRVGAGDADGYAINGRTLVYTLCEHLQTKVVAAMDANDPSEYDQQTGDYKPSVNHLRPCSWEWISSDTPPVYNNPNGTSEPSLLRVAHTPLVNVRMKRIHALVPAARRMPIDTDVLLECALLNDPSLLHAAAELRVAIAMEGNDVAATMFANGRVLRVGSDVFAVDNHERVRRVIAELLSRRS